MDMSIKKCTMLPDLLSLESQLVFNTGLDQFPLGSKSTLHSECLKSMLRPCYQLRFILTSLMWQIPILNGEKTTKWLRCMEWKISHQEVSPIYLKEFSKMKQLPWFMRIRNHLMDLKPELILVIKLAEEAFIVKLWTVFNSKFCKILFYHDLQGLWR